MSSRPSTQREGVPTLLCFHAAACITLALGCAGEDEVLDPPDARGEALARAEPVASTARDAGSVAPYRVEVTANGTGCPAGTWLTTVAGDSFVTTFSSYEVTASDGVRLGIKDCYFVVRLRSRVPVSYAVGALSFAGYAFLEPGVRGTQSAAAYFAGGPVPALDRELRTDLTGPVDRAYAVERTHPDEDLVWTPCGHDRNINVVTRLRVQRSPNQGTGYMNLSALGVPGRVAWTLKVRACSVGGSDAGVPANEETSDPIRSLDAGAI